MRGKNIGLFLLTLTVFLSFGCATADKAHDISEVSIKASAVSNQDLKSRFGNQYISNPYLPPESLVLGKQYEFFVVSLELSLPQDADISLRADLTDTKGYKVADLYDREHLAEFWEFWRDDSSKTLQAGRNKRSKTISQTTLPSMHFTQKKGATEFFLVFIGKNPIQRPATLNLEVVIDSKDMYIYSTKLE